MTLTQYIIRTYGSQTTLDMKAILDECQKVIDLKGSIQVSEVDQAYKLALYGNQ